MGLFLAVSSIIGRSQNEVARSLGRYTESVSGGLEQKNGIGPEDENYCIIKEEANNTSILYPRSYLEWDDSSQYISKDLNTSVFSFHIHDGDLWMYVLYNNGEIVDQFNPVPDYWEDDISETEANSWKGDAQVVANFISYITPSDIENYLVRWAIDAEEPMKSYPSDVYAQEDWQLIDFMNKLKLPNLIDDNQAAAGTTYKIWTTQLKGESLASSNKKYNDVGEKPWWKFW